MTENENYHIIKDATNSYTISSGALFVGSFDTTYSIVGNARSMEASKDLIISTITEDFDNSPTVGYVNNTSSSSTSQANLNQPSLPNPLATKTDIDEKIRSEITTSINNAAKCSGIDILPWVDDTFWQTQKSLMIVAVSVDVYFLINLPRPSSL